MMRPTRVHNTDMSNIVREKSAKKKTSTNKTKLLLLILVFLALIEIIVLITILAENYFSRQYNPLQDDYTNTSISVTPTPTPSPTASAPTPVEEVSTTLVFSLIGDEEISVFAAPSYTDEGYLAALPDGTDITEFVTITGEVVPYVPGEYTITYTLNYPDFDIQTVERKINVVPCPFPETVYPEGKVIYLTFDDGPSQYTQKLLDVLDKYDAKATFFVTGQDSDNINLIGEAYRRGHSIGVHTNSHVYHDIYSGEEAFFADFADIQNIIYQQTGEYTKICRFPGGSSNTVSRFNPGIMTRLALSVQSMGYQYFDWNADSKDAGGANNKGSVYANVIAEIQKQEYPVVLQHDIKGYSVAAVEDILVWGKNNGYTFLPLDVTSPAPHEEIAN